VNAAKDATELVARLRAYHYTAQTDPQKKALAQVRAGLACRGNMGAPRGAGRGLLAG
jgi:hypothetical protein